MKTREELLAMKDEAKTLHEQAMVAMDKAASATAESQAALGKATSAYTAFKNAVEDAYFNEP